jgi:ribonuclease HI
MTTPYAKELTTRANQFITQLAKKSIVATLDTPSMREYHVKLKAEFNGKSVGNIILYYAPTKKTFSISCHELTVTSLIAWVEGCFGSALPVATPAKKNTETTKKTTEIAKGVQIYVDGSYLKRRVGFGVVILKDGAKIQEFFGRVTEDTSTRQVAGELVATMTALDWCQQNDIREVEIFYDYTGIEKWAKKKWQANLPLTQRYQAYMQATPVKVRFRKVESHTGNTWNDVADELAKKGTQA